MMPLVVVWPTPNGLPMARTRSPTSIASESARFSAGNCSFALIFSTARSERSSFSKIAHSNSRPSASAIFTSSASRMTWLLVTTRPLGSTRTPEPSEDCMRCGWGCSSPKNWPKNGSSKNGDCRLTTRAVYTLTTDGAAAFTSGAKESCISSRPNGRRFADPGGVGDDAERCCVVSPPSKSRRSWSRPAPSFSSARVAVVTCDRNVRKSTKRSRFLLIGHSPSGLIRSQIPRVIMMQHGREKGKLRRLQAPGNGVTMAGADLRGR